MKEKELCCEQTRSNHPKGEKMQRRVPMRTGAKYCKGLMHKDRYVSVLIDRTQAGHGS